MQEAPPMELSFVLSSQPRFWKFLLNEERKGHAQSVCTLISQSLNSSTVCLISSAPQPMTLLQCADNCCFFQDRVLNIADSGLQEQTCLKKHFTNSLASVPRVCNGHRSTKYHSWPTRYSDVNGCPFPLREFRFIFEYLMRVVTLS